VVFASASAKKAARMITRVAVFLLTVVSSASSAFAQLTATDVQIIISHAVARAVRISPNSVIAVTDREGFVLAVWVVRGGAAGADEVATAVSKAGTAAFLSSNQNAFTSRTAGFIIQQHFPPGVNNTSTGPLVGVGLSNLFFSDINKFKAPGTVSVFSSSPGLFVKPVIGTSLDGSPGGVPLYKGGILVGGIGVTGDRTPGPPAALIPVPPISPLIVPLLPPGPLPPFARNENPFVFIASYDKDEDVALAGQSAFAPSPSITADNVFINGIRLPYVVSAPRTRARRRGARGLRGNEDPNFPVILGAQSTFAYPAATFGGVSGQIRQPIIADPMPGTINGQPRLSAADIADVIKFAAQRVKITRAGIRLPIGTQMQVFITVVNNPDADGVAPTVLGTFRTGEATFFSWDVAVQKARTAVFYSRHDFLGFGLKVAMSTRAIGFLAQRFYPPGIDKNAPGPFFTEQDKLSGFAGTEPNVVFTATADTTPPGAPPLRNGIRTDLPNGITIFPGGFPLYRNGVLIGAIGISGDGVDQDDIVGASGTHDFLAPMHIRSDQFFVRGARLPYAKFPRDPGL
jgi:uncharacterized protein GlcG (DUF336 family)